MKRILIIGSQHGNELLGERLYAFIQSQPKRHDLQIEYMLANPKAREKRVRYFESDMNRSYTGQANTHEERCANELLIKLTDHPFDLVIDAHTTTVNQAPCIILPAITSENQDYLRATLIKYVVVMKHAFVAQSLIGNVPRAISLEVSNVHLGPDMYRKLYAGLVDFALGQGHYPQKQVFEVDGLIEKAKYPAAVTSRMKNFQRSTSGFYPVLIGENSYKKQTSYLGFRASHKKRVLLDSVQV